MQKLRVTCFGVSLDGYGAGSAQSLEHPLGVGGRALLEWLFYTRTFSRMNGKDEGDTGTDDDYAARGIENVGAWILGRNMFGPVRGSWPDDSWKGWWGPNPPFHTPVFVLTHHPRDSIGMEGGTSFHFVSEGIDAAYRAAMDAALGKDVRLGGGAATIRQYLSAGLVDEMHLALVPVLLGGGEPLFPGIDLLKMGFRCAEYSPSARAAHVVLAKERPDGGRALPAAKKAWV